MIIGQVVWKISIFLKHIAQNMQKRRFFQKSWQRDRRRIFYKKGKGTGVEYSTGPEIFFELQNC